MLLCFLYDVSRQVLILAVLIQELAVSTAVCPLAGCHLGPGSIWQVAQDQMMMDTLVQIFCNQYPFALRSLFPICPPQPFHVVPNLFLGLLWSWAASLPVGQCQPQVSWVKIGMYLSAELRDHVPLIDFLHLLRRRQAAVLSLAALPIPPGMYPLHFLHVLVAAYLFHIWHSIDPPKFNPCIKW